MSRAPFIVIDGRLYRWKDILGPAARAAGRRRRRRGKPTGVICNLAR
jgi:hypothetical protein